MPQIRTRRDAVIDKFLQRIGSYTQTYVFLKDRTLTLRLLIFSGFLVVFPLLLLGIIAYRESSTHLEKQATAASWQIIEQVRSHIEYYITGFEIDSIKLLNQPEMRSFLLIQNREQLEQSGLEAIILQLLKDTSYSRSDIAGMKIILDGITVVEIADPAAQPDVDDQTADAWYRSLPDNGDIVLVSRTIRVRDRNEPVISMMKRLSSPYTLEPVGTLVMDINFKRIQEVSEKVTVGRTGFLTILNESGYYMYHPDSSVLGMRDTSDMVSRMKSHDNGFFLVKDGAEEYVTFSYSPYLKWYIMTSYPKRELLLGVETIGRTLLWTVVCILGIAYVLGFGLAASLVRPLRHLQRLMQKVKRGDLTARAVVESKDEIGQLTHDFNKMVERLGVLLEEVYVTKLREQDMTLRQRETELKMLQSQMNPHFLYNSLETIRGMALDKGAQDISSMTTALARLLRYNLDNSSTLVTLKEELAVCDMYLRIQSFRFEDKLRYSFHIPEWAFAQKVVKFSLQPLIENGVIHGTEPREGLVNITISAQLESEGRFSIRIQDTGIGISEDRLAQIQCDLKERDASAGGAHIGIVNVHRRIAQLFGEDYGLHLTSERNRGTEVTICFPYTPETQ
ncbi:sensor histidine kinase [Paenibacillus chartarius]|uniref:Sensor histidine kinase n=1 Tax=Paenibacillus chartarius TaxID=747481 RepID=A0ABV6DK22_9BACL